MREEFEPALERGLGVAREGVEKRLDDRLGLLQERELLSDGRARDIPDGEGALDLDGANDRLDPLPNDF